MERQTVSYKRGERFGDRRRRLAPLLRKYKSRKLDPILEILHRKDYDESTKKPLRKYLLIISVSIVEDFLMHLFAKTIDNNNVNISIFGRNIAKSFSPGKLTKGQHTARCFNFAAPYLIDRKFSILLKTNSKFNSQNMSFFEAVEKADWYDPFRNYKEYRTKSLYKNWDNFIGMFEKRNELVHGMLEIRLFNAKVATFCDNVLTFLDIAIALCKMDNSVFEILESESQINSGRKGDILAESSFQ